MRGVTLAEVVISLGMFAVALLVFAQVTTFFRKDLARDAREEHVHTLDATLSSSLAQDVAAARDWVAPALVSTAPSPHLEIQVTTPAAWRMRLPEPLPDPRPGSWDSGPLMTVRYQVQGDELQRLLSGGGESELQPLAGPVANFWVVHRPGGLVEVTLSSRGRAFRWCVGRRVGF